MVALQGATQGIKRPPNGRFIGLPAPNPRLAPFPFAGFSVVGTVLTRAW